MEKETFGVKQTKLEHLFVAPEPPDGGWVETGAARRRISDV